MMSEARIDIEQEQLERQKRQKEAIAQEKQKLFNQYHSISDGIKEETRERNITLVSSILVDP